ncbi:hypothetical protein M5D96_012505 [Drosophila gunungcola]|uniref:Uncharacterized protein n=1 Tax=Drosophila gunungcola TaxID=103775 RepID=A0A9Q0BJE0_9MUSC|nr:hypothetical protein M5D96_012505 [Drosophila gunungcola]
MAHHNNNNINNNIIPTKGNLNPNTMLTNKGQKPEVTDAADYPIRHSFGEHGELSTVVNIEVFDDQLSLSSISTNSRLSLEGPPSQSSPPLSLTNGLMDTNLMHFSESATATGAVPQRGGSSSRFEVDVDLNGEDEDEDEAEDDEEEDADLDRERDREDHQLGRRNL